MAQSPPVPVRVLSQRAPVPFDDAAAAWFWFWQCQIAREDGARFVADAGAVARPCDPDDVARVALALVRRRLLDRRHLRIIGAFGRALAPPDPRLAEEAAAARLWDEAMDRLATPLRARGIIL